jgi:two-component system, chemotaxis family, sensor kinase CheA
MLGQMTASSLFGELDPGDTSLNESVAELGRVVGTRMSLLSRTGVVVADSEGGELGTLAPEGDAPEIAQAKATGIGRAIRGPRGAQRLFVARSIVRDQTLLGFARASMPMESVRAEAVAVRIQIAWGALVGIGIAVVVALVMSLRIVRPVRALAAGARGIGSGDYGRQIPVSSDDELGELARAFNEMSRSLRLTIDELDGRNRDMRIVLDNVKEGLVTLAMDGTMSREKSAVVEEWFGPPASNARYWDYFVPDNAVQRQMLRAHWEQLAEGFAPLQLSLRQIPKRLDHAGRLFDLDYIPVLAQGELAKVLLVIADVTAQVQATRAEAEQRELLALFVRIMRDKTGFAEFVSEAWSLVQEITGDPRPPADQLRRALHTLKGNASVFGLTRVSTLCHVLEDRLEDAGGDLDAKDRLELATLWERSTERIRRLIGDGDVNSVEIEEEEYEALLAAATHGETPRRLREMLVSLKLQRFDRRLERIADLARSLARRLGKGEIRVVVDCDAGLRFARQAMAPFWSVFSHVIRNAVDHGTRASASPQAHPGTMRLGARRLGATVSIDVADDGPGIDWEDVERRAASRGMPHGTREDCARALFSEGFSTRDEVTTTSGRGVGLYAVACACEALGGSASVTSERGEGASFRFDFPFAAVTGEDA